MFQTARKQAPAIIFIDEIDSIGRKRGAGLGGGHDEREQTLNQILSEMDGFEATEGIVMMAATNRPDILDAALLRPGRFDRQIVVPLPDLDERLPILQVHSKDKKIGPDVDLEIVARGTPGMSGADLANLVNEAALHAVRRGGDVIEMQDFEAARDRVLMGQRREAMVLSEDEEERVAVPRGWSRRARLRAPERRPGAQGDDPADGHGARRHPAAPDRGAPHLLPRVHQGQPVRAHGRARAPRCSCSTPSRPAPTTTWRQHRDGPQMVREWGMSDRIGPMAWGSQGAVFLGDDIMHTRDYSDETSRVIDEEVERILRDAGDAGDGGAGGAPQGLQAVADSLVERETIDGGEVGRLVDGAFGRSVHDQPDVPTLRRARRRGRQRTAAAEQRAPRSRGRTGASTQRSVSS